MAEKIDILDTNPFLDSPAQYLVKTIVQEIKKVTLWSQLFGQFIDPYKRMDYSVRNLPALRVYETGYTKEFDSWFINGDVFMDVIYPSFLRRSELQFIQDHVASALLQQFRRPQFFQAVETPPALDSEADIENYRLIGVPGLNELGKRFTVDKNLGFQISDEEIVPLTQITVNFRIDLRQWDKYLTDNNRTKDDPFEATLEDLTQIVGQIEGLLDDGTTELEIGATDQTPGGDDE